MSVASDPASAARRLAALDPGRVEAQQQLGLATAARALADAVRPLRRVTWLAPLAADAHLNLGIALFALGRHSEAGSAFRHMLVLAPGDRAEVEVDAGAGAVDVTTALWSAAGGASYGDDRVLFSVEGGESAPAAPLDFVFSGAAPSLDPGTTELLYTFAGGAPDTDWLINGEAWPDVTVQHVALGAEVFIELRNLSATNHPFHLHGHRFEVLSIDDAAPEWARWEDTLDLGIRSVVRLRLPANNPGEWALHCHLLGHEQGGMMTQLNVE